MGEETGGIELINEIEREINDIKAKGDTVTDKKTVYFEISPAPWMYSFGSGTFLNEMIEIIGAVNIFADQETWVAVSDEDVLDANPDVILTNANYIEDAIGEIKERPGWDAINAVRDETVFYIDQDSSSRPSQNIIKALREMAVTVYPELFS
jgi:iron complex transport system substrate-binding protein